MSTNQIRWPFRQILWNDQTQVGAGENRAFFVYHFYSFVRLMCVCFFFRDTGGVYSDELYGATCKTREREREKQQN